MNILNKKKKHVKFLTKTTGVKYQFFLRFTSQVHLSAKRFVQNLYNLKIEN